MASVLHKILASLLASLAFLMAPSSALGAQAKNFWLVSSTGQVFAYGKAKPHGSEYRKHRKGRVLGIKGTRDGGGYWIITSRAHYAFGDARNTRKFRYTRGALRPYRGNLRPRGLRGRIVGYAVATIPPTRRKHHKPAGGRTTTTTTTTTTPTTTASTPTPTTTTPTPTVDCSAVAIDTTSLSDATATDPYSQTLTGGGISGGSWLWAIQSGSLPSGLTLSSSGTIAGTPTQATGGTLSAFTVQATNSQCPGSTARNSFTISVADPAMSITTTSLPDGTYGQPYSITTLQATGGNGQYQWSGYSLPDGLTISADGVLSGTPARTGTFHGVAITLTDTGGADPVYAYYTITISDPPMQITSPSTLNDGQATVAYSNIQFTATGGAPGSTSSDYEWSATGLPSGMSMSSTGVLSGTPASEGDYTVAVTLTDSLNTADHITQDFPLHIAYPPLKFTTTTLTANQGQAYTGHVVAQGGEAPYSMYWLAGSLPTGMSFNNGTITVGSTVASGDYQFTIGLTDSQSSPATAQETFNVWVTPSQVSPDLNVTSTQDGTIWSGYVEQASTAFISVSGTFNVPSAITTGGADDGTWVGIDGDGTSNLIQAGVNADRVSGQSSYEAWWETVGADGSAQNLPPQYEFQAAPGDTINVNIWQVSTGTWEITLNDATSGQGFAARVSYTGSDLTAEWITEGGAGNPAQFYLGTIDFSNLAASQAGNGMIGLSMNGSSGTSTPSALTGSGFGLTY